MDDIAGALTKFFDWIPGWADAAFAVIAAASAITALTPSPADDRWVAKVRRMLEVLALNVGHAKRPPSS